MKKKRGLIIILIVILLIILLAGGAFAYIYMATDILRTDKEMFLKYFSQIGTEGEFWDSDIQQYYDKKQQTPYENSGKITVNADIPEELDISVENLNDLSIEFSGKTDKTSDIAEQDVEIIYNKEKEVVLPIAYKQYENIVGIKFNDLGSKYIAIRNEDLKEFAEKFGINKLDEIPDEIDLSEAKEEYGLSPEEIEQIKQIYGVVLQEQLLEENFSKIKNDNEESYTLELTGEQIKNIIIKMLETTKQNTLLIDKVNEYVSKIDEESDKIDEDSIDELIENINGEDFSEISNLKITLIQKNKMLNEIIIECGENNITISKINNEDTIEYKTNVKLKDSEEDATEVSVYLNVKFSGLNANKTKETYNVGFDVNTEDTSLGYEYNITNSVEFKEFVSIDEFEKNKAVFLNDYDAETITNFLSQVVTRLSDINKEQMSKLGLQEDENPLIYSNPITMLVNVIADFASDTMNGSSSLQNQEVNAFNARFENYIGTDLKGSIVNSLIITVRNSNLSEEERTVTIILDGNILNEEERVDSSKIYTVNAGYDDDGYISEIQISKESD